jgi:hypothetical protein
MTRHARQDPDEKQCWSAEIGRKSDAVDLDPGVSSEDDPKRIARSL